MLLPCIHRSLLPKNRIKCSCPMITCASDLPLRFCEQCPYLDNGVRFTKGCMTAFDERNLAPGAPGHRFNPSIVEYGGQYLICWRHKFGGSRLFLGSLNEDFKALDSFVQLDLKHEKC